MADNTFVWVSEAHSNGSGAHCGSAPPVSPKEVRWLGWGGGGGRRTPHEAGPLFFSLLLHRRDSPATPNEVGHTRFCYASARE